MAVTTTQVANLAFGWLGVAPVADIDTDTGRPAELMRGQFTLIRDAVLEDRDWSFAMARAQVTKSGTVPAFDYPAQYPLPAGCLRVVEVKDPSNSGSIDAFAAAIYPDDGAPMDWVKEGDFLLAQSTAAKLNVRFIQSVASPTSWSPAFVQAFAARLASDLAVPICQDRALQETNWKLYQAKLQSAQSSDGRVGRSQRVRANRLARRRR
jgi:hypothetical protein